jgi:6,7-dimethyl-8-ribityllumazine synthase
MNGIREMTGALDGSGKRFAVVASRFNGSVVDRLVEGALECLRRHGVEEGATTLVRVPGAWEIPLALDELAASGGYDGLVALGAVIRGETPHFDYVSAEASRGIAEVSARHRLPVGFGLLTCDTAEQAAERAGGKAGNKGWEAALAAVEMAGLVARLRSGDGGEA